MASKLLSTHGNRSSLLYLKSLLMLSSVTRGKRCEELLMRRLCTHKTRSLGTTLCIFNVKGSVVEVRKVIFLTVCAKSLPLLAALWKGKIALPYFFIPEWSSSILWWISQAWNISWYYWNPSASFWWGFFHLSKLQIVNLKDSLKDVCRWETCHLFARSNRFLWVLKGMGIVAFVSKRINTW